MTNPLRADWATPYELPPFDRIDDGDFAPAFDAALDEARANIAAIADTAEAPSFANTCEALERADAPLDKVLAPFFTLLGTCANEAREALARDISPRLAAYASEVAMNAPLFARLDALWEARETLDLTPEQARLLEKQHRRFTRSGARLEGAEAERLKQIMARLAELGTSFTQAMVADERNWSMTLAPEDLSPLPAFLQGAATAAGDGTPIITLSRSLIVPFLQFSPNRALRQKAFDAWTARGVGQGEDNRARAAETLKLRAERAVLLGYDSFADFKLEHEMASNPGAVRDLLMQVWAPARAAAEADQAILTERLRADGETGPLEPWDWRYYSEARRKEEHDLDEAELKPYFQLDRMIEAVFDTAHRLFGIEATPVEAPLWHDDCRAWEMTRNGEFLALFIGDYFARPGKRSGAWCSALRPQQKLAGDIRPIVVNVCNFAKSDPALLSYDDASTLFHEFGHALHQMLSDVTYESLSGTSVARDFVELPSQLLEHWLDQPALLDRFATHVETGAPMPEALRDRLLAARSYDAGFDTVEYLASALVDLGFHDSPPPADPMQRQAEILDEIGLPRAIAMRHATPNFAHVFSGDGYSSGYYSYMWSEVMDADAFEAFEETGDVFDPDTAKRLEDEILSRGGTVDEATAYTAFRGRMPGVGPLLKGRGLA
ncbi:MAG: peptidase M3 [Rhodobacterales bacterium]|nr:MAG: peptidase M3 [Rhodobacterales bacterium]